MSTQWLAVQSFQHSQDVLAAINTLSIHVKLKLAGVPDEEREEAAGRARSTLATFFKELDMLMHEAQQGEMKPLMGVDPRLRQLVKSFLAAKRDRRRFQSALFQNTPAAVQQWLSSDKEEDQQALLHCLEELRAILEAHVYADTARILGEI